MNQDMLKPVLCTGASKRDLNRFLDPVRRRTGFAVHQTQPGMLHRDARPLRPFRTAVLEVVTRHDGDSLRPVHTSSPKVETGPCSGQPADQG